MVRAKALIRSVILDAFSKVIRENGAKDVYVYNYNEIDAVKFPEGFGFQGNLSPAALETIGVEFSADESKMGRLVKAIVSCANKGNFGKQKIFLAPFLSE